ncbi:MAG: ERF family protein [Methanobrevibacter sp.]|nr:ERF family protein [Methanobrevibacter sp.]
MSIHRRLSEIHKELLETKIPKTGYNKHKGFRYYELEDIMPYVINACYKHKITLQFSFVENTAILKLVDWDDEKKYIPFRIQVPELIVPEKNPNNKLIQDTGANVSYLQRYLLKLAFPCINDKDIIDLDDGNSEKSNEAGSSKKQEKSKSSKPKQEAEKVEDTHDLDVNQLIIEAEKVLKEKKGLSDSEINLRALRMQVLSLKKWTVAEKREILKYFNEKEEDSK